MPLGACSDSGRTQPYWFLDASVSFRAASTNSVRVRRHGLDAGCFQQVEVHEYRIDEGRDRKHVALAVDLDDGGHFLRVEIRGGHKVIQGGDRALLRQIVHPGSVKADHIAQRARRGADNDLIACVRIGPADKGDLDARVLRLEVIHDSTKRSGRKLRLPPLDKFQIRLCHGAGDAKSTSDRCRLQQQHRFSEVHTSLPR